MADLWPPLAAWLAGQGLALPSWTEREFGGFRFALIAAVVGGARTLYNSLEGLTVGKIGADLAVAIAAIAAILIGEPIVAAEVIFIGLVGECLEAFTFDRTQKALRSLVQLFPKRCWVLRNGVEERIFTAELVVGDHVVVKPGGKIPADGTVLDGRSSLDTSPLTGESLPREVGPNEQVLAGSINQDGALTISVEKVAHETVAGQVIALTGAALKDKSQGERTADRLARYFLPIVLAVSLLTFLFNAWYQSWPAGPDEPAIGWGTASRLALYPTLAVLVAACPCPLVLATPAAVVAALGRLAGTGVLVKGGSALERLANVTCMAFDKTGTLTEGKPELAEVVPLDGNDSDNLLSIAASAEKGSEHPLAKLILKEAGRRGLELTASQDFRAHPGSGVTAKVADRAVVVGTPRLMQELDIPITPEAESMLSRFDQEGQTALLVAVEGKIVGGISAQDRLRPEAAGVVAELQELGISPIALLTGDRDAAAQAVARRLPLTYVEAGLLPGQKAEWVASAGQTIPLPLAGQTKPGDRSNRIAFVGDGVNDAPALARADVGIAIGSGTDVAAEAGDIIMMGDPLKPLPMLVRLGRETARVIRQNIIWFGFVVNFFGVLLTGWLWPIFASSPEWYEKAPLAGVIYHQFGSLAVLLNSMRLLSFERATQSRLYANLRNAYTAFDNWMSRFRVDDILHEAIHFWKPITAVATLVTAIVWISSSVIVIRASEVGVVQRFGAVQGVIDPGLHFRWPWPIETTTIVEPNRVRLVEVGFRRLTGEQLDQLYQAEQTRQELRGPGFEPADDSAMTWGGTHGSELAKLTDEALLITGDGDLIELMATIRYEVADPVQYLFATPDLDRLLRSCAESVFREMAAAESFLELLTVRRSDFQNEAEARLNDKLAVVAPSGLGIRVTGLTIHDMHPPQEVVGAYHAVAEAIQRKDRAVNEALAEATRRKSRAAEESLRIVRRAQADADSKTATAEAARDAFFARSESRLQLPESAESELKERHQQLLREGVTVEEAGRQIEKLRQEMVAERRFLTDFRLSLDATVRALRGRDKILFDAEQVPGRRHLLFMDPETSRPAPFAFPRTGGIQDPDPELDRPPEPQRP